MEGRTETPSVALKRHLDETGWTQDDLARVVGRPRQAVNEIIAGKKAITPEMAVALGAAFGTAADYWLNLETTFRLSRLDFDPSIVQRRAKLFQMAPVQEMMRRQWIKKTRELPEIEAELCRFFGISLVEDEPRIVADMRMTSRLSELSPAQKAWCFRAARLARAQHVSPYNESNLYECAAKLRAVAAFPEEIYTVPKVLAHFGIRLVIVEPLAGTRIDGAAFWLDQESPAIALTIRHDRIDSFWFTLCHELAHIKYRDSEIMIDVDLVGETQVMPPLAKEEVEQRADREAADMLIPKNELESFIIRVRPMYYKTRIIQFANRLRIHPGIIVGQLQHRGEISFGANRELLSKVRELATSAAIVDGWGRVVTI